MKLKEVFTPGGQPSVTYVSREHLQLERKVKEAISRGYSINVVTGPTKSGKTVLCRHVLNELVASCIIEGGQIRSEEEFWVQIASHLNIGDQLIRKETATTFGEAGGGIYLGMPSTSSVNLGAKAAKARITERSINYTVALQPAIFVEMRRLDMSLLVDDFHYIPPDIQKSIIQSLKGAVYDGLSVILLAVPHRAFDPMTVEDEVQGCFKHIEIPPWEINDLLQIPMKGFEALNVETSDDLNNEICINGFGNPLLVQEICSELCIKNEISGSQDKRKIIGIGYLAAAFADTAQSKGFPKYNKLKSGPDTKKKGS